MVTGEEARPRLRTSKPKHALSPGNAVILLLSASTANQPLMHAWIAMFLLQDAEMNETIAFLEPAKSRSVELNSTIVCCEGESETLDGPRRASLEYWICTSVAPLALLLVSLT